MLAVYVYPLASTDRPVVEHAPAAVMLYCTDGAAVIALGPKGVV